MDSIRSVYPKAVIEANRTDNYPIRVIVTVNVGTKTVEAWSGRQQSLFRKYSSQRTKSIAEIKANVKSVVDSMMKDSEDEEETQEE